MDPAFPDLVAEWAEWESQSPDDGSDDSFLDAFDDDCAIDDLADAILIAAALKDVAQTRAW